MIAIAGGKGGCGKTTTTVAIARAVTGGSGVPVLGVESDWDMPDLASLARTAPLPSVPFSTVSYETLVGEGPKPGFTVLEEPTGPNVPDRRRWLNSIDRSCQNDGLLTLLDCPAGAGKDTAVPIDAATGALLVSTAEPASLGDTAKTAAMARELGTPVIGAVVAGTDVVPDGTGQLLGTERIHPVPEAEDPLKSDRVKRIYTDLVAGLELGTGSGRR